ncbi:MAG: type II toxin-antitoxin system HicB family antitoxin [Treponema sp.]
MYIYPAIFYKEREGYSVVFNDIELSTIGENLEQAILMAEEALTGRLYLMLKDGESLPTPSKIEDITKPKEAEFITLIKTDKKYLSKEKTIRKNLRIPMWLANAAENAGLNFSQELQLALKNKLHIESF